MGADLPNRLLIESDRYETRAAVLEGERVAEVHVERTGRRSLVGAIFKGRVMRVLPGMNAAFVDLGLERHGYLFAAEAAAYDEAELGPGGRAQRRIGELVSDGQQLLVQVVKDAAPGKGARLSARLSLAGRLLVFLPAGRSCSVSKQIDDADERDRLEAELGRTLGGKGGAIARTAAAGAERQELEVEAAALHASWQQVQDAAGQSACPALLYRDFALHLRMVRDQPASGWQSIRVAGERAADDVEEYLRRHAPTLLARFERRGAEHGLLAGHGVDAAIEKALKSRVWLSNGGYLVVDTTEALTTIDVNTGGYVGERSLDDTILATNLDAAREAARQIRLRDLGGIVVIDFIDMAGDEDRDRVLAALDRELARDRVRTWLAPHSHFGLVEITRKRSRPNLRAQMTERCPTCRGDRRTIDVETAALGLRRRLLADQAAPESRGKVGSDVRVAVSRRLAGYLETDGGSFLEQLESELACRVGLEIDDSLDAAEFEILSG